MSETRNETSPQTERRRSGRTNKSLEEVLSEYKLSEKDKKKLQSLHDKEIQALILKHDGELNDTKVNLNREITDIKRQRDNYSDENTNLQNQYDDLLDRLAKETAEKDALNTEIKRMEDLTDELLMNQVSITEDKEEEKPCVAMIVDSKLKGLENQGYPDTAMWDIVEEAISSICPSPHNH